MWVGVNILQASPEALYLERSMKAGHSESSVSPTPDLFVKHMQTFSIFDIELLVGKTVSSLVQSPGKLFIFCTDGSEFEIPLAEVRCE